MQNEPIQASPWASIWRFAKSNRPENAHLIAPNAVAFWTTQDRYYKIEQWYVVAFFAVLVVLGPASFGVRVLRQAAVWLLNLRPDTSDSGLFFAVMGALDHFGWVAYLVLSALLAWPVQIRFNRYRRAALHQDDTRRETVAQEDSASGGGFAPVRFD